MAFALAKAFKSAAVAFYPVITPFTSLTIPQTPPGRTGAVKTGVCSTTHGTTLRSRLRRSPRHGSKGFEQRQQLVERRQLLFINEQIGILHLDPHLFSIGDEDGEM